MSAHAISALAAAPAAAASLRPRRGHHPDGSGREKTLAPTNLSTRRARRMEKKPCVVRAGVDGGEFDYQKYAPAPGSLSEQIGILGVHHVAVIVESLERSKAFYQGGGAASRRANPPAHSAPP